MFEIAVLICRYLFIFYIAYFLFQAAQIVLTERGFIFSDIALCLSKQKLAIIFFHLTALLILAYKPAEYKFSSYMLIIGCVSMLLLIFGNSIINKIYPYSCPLLWNCIFFITDIGLITLMRLNPRLAQKQLIWIFAGFGITLLIPLIFRILPRLNKLKYLYLALGFLLLVSTLIFGNKSGGAQNWIMIGSFGFQPSEAVKILFIFYLASEFSKPRTIKQLLIPSAISAFFILCLVFQTDLGSALIFFMTYLIIVYISTQKELLFFLGLFMASIASFAAYKLFSHVRVRVATWQNPWQDIDRGGYQIAQSLFAIGTPGIFGSGLTRGYANYIPVVERDFIFSAICEELSVVFAIGMLIIFVIIFYKGMKISLSTSNSFLSLLSAGLTGLLCFQTFLITGGVTKLIPLTGVTLPFVSYGGTSMVISFITIGVLQWVCSINNHRKIEMDMLKEDEHAAEGI